MTTGERAAFGFGLIALGILLGLGFSSEIGRISMAAAVTTECGVNSVSGTCLQGRANVLTAWGLFISIVSLVVTALSVWMVIASLTLTRQQITLARQEQENAVRIQKQEFQAYVEFRIARLFISEDGGLYAELTGRNYGRTPARDISVEAAFTIVEGQSSINGAESHKHTVNFRIIHPSDHEVQINTLMLYGDRTPFNEATYYRIFATANGTYNDIFSQPWADTSGRWFVGYIRDLKPGEDLKDEL